MSKFPNDYDDDSTLPPVHDNITEIGGYAINSLREAVVNIEHNLGLNGQGTTSSLSERLGISIDLDGSIKPSALTSLGLVTLPITNDQVSETADIVESKLKLDYRTMDLYNYIRDLAGDVNQSLGWINVSGSKLEPHIAGSNYRHVMDHILVDESSSNYLKNKYDNNRDNDNSYTVVNDLNSEMLDHHWSDSLPYGSGAITTRNGSQFPSNYGHTASAIYLQTERFTTIPQTANDVQLFAEYIDNASIFLYGTRIQNLYTNGISRVSRSSSLQTDGYGAPVVPETLATAYLRLNGALSTVWDNIDNGDDIVQFFPDSSVLDNNLFDEQFALVKPGDVLRINYGGLQTSYIIKEKKYNSVSDTFIVRIAGKNLFYTETASARIDRSLVNDNKFGVLATSAVNNEFNAIPSLLVGDPRGAQTLGNGFNSAQFDESHYNLYLALFETGDPLDGYTILPGIDVTGNLGKTPAKYTLDSIVESTNKAFRTAGFNYRFMAFKHKGEFGIMIADSIGNAGFSIVNAIVADDGVPNETETNLELPNNVVGVFTDTGDVAPDPLGLGVNGSGSASPPFMGTYGSPEAAQNPTKLFLPLNRNNYYINGVERDKIPLEIGQAQDEYGDGYWEAEATLEPAGSTVKIKYTIDSDLSQTGLAPGKTVVIRDTTNGSLVNSGRYIIETCVFNCPPNEYTELVVYDAVHGASFTPTTTIDGYVTYPVSLYFDSDSPNFNARSATDFTDDGARFKRHFEVYSDEDGKTFTHERARFVKIATDVPTTNATTINGSTVLYTGDEISKFNFVKVSPKLKGYSYPGSVNKITLHIETYVASSGIITGYLCDYNGTTRLKRGPTIVGKIGQVVRFYDFTNIDYIDLYLDIDNNVSDITAKDLDIQLFPSLNSDHEVMMISTCQLNDVTNKVTRMTDQRQFGNTSEKDLSSSALDFISAGDRHLHINGVIRGFELESPLESGTNPDEEQLYLAGGVALVNGNIVQMNNELVAIPYVNELYLGSEFNMHWALCVAETGEYKFIALTDYDQGFGTVSNEDRNVLVQGKDSVQYYVESATFEDIVTKRKDVAILYIIRTAVTVTSTINITAYIDDARRYANDSDSSIPLTYTSGKNQGNFKSATAIFNWLQFNKYNGRSFLSDVSESLANDVTLSSDSQIDVDGQNSTTISISGSTQLTIGNNVTLRNMTLEVTPGSFIINNNSSNIKFINCTITSNTLTSIELITMSGASNIVFDGCTLDMPSTNMSDSEFLVEFTNCTNIKIINSTISFNSSATEPASLLAFDECSNVIVNNNDTSGNAQMGILLNETSNIKITNNRFVSSYALDNGHSYSSRSAFNLNSFTYDEDDLVNVGRGYIYSNVVNELQDIIINNNSFSNTNSTYFAPDGKGSNRLSFIQFELSTSVSLLKNVQVNYNKFEDQSGATGKSNYKAVIAFVNTSPQSVYNDTFPRIANCSIEHNWCDKDQLILMTSNVVSGEMKYPGLVPEGTDISKNTCGTIGYWISRGSRTDGEGEHSSPGRGHRIGSLTIDNNQCKFITCLDETGTRYHANDAESNSYSDYGSGIVIISNNITCRINVGMSHDEDSSLKIIGNDLTAYWQSYFAKYGSYGDAGENAISIMGVGRSVFSSVTEPANIHKNMCIVSNNTTSHGYTIDGSNTSITWTHSYLDGILYTNTYCNITDNIFKGIGNNVTYNIISLITDYSTVTGNTLSRIDSSINSYVYIDTTATTLSDSGIITDNYFDNYSVDGTDEETVKYDVTYPFDWIIRRNRNQTEYASISLSNGHHFNYDSTNGFGEEGGFQYWNWSETASDEWYIKPVKSAPPSLTESDTYNSNVIRIKDNHITSLGPVPRRFSYKADLSSHIPDDVELIEATIGYRRFQGTFKTSNNGNFDSRFVVSFLQHGPTSAVDARDNWNLDHFSSADDEDDNISSEVTSGLLNATGDDLNGTASNETFQSTQLFSTVVNGTNTNRRPVSVNFDAVWECNDELDMMISPIIIKYRW